MLIDLDSIDVNSTHAHSIKSLAIFHFNLDLESKITLGAERASLWFRWSRKVYLQFYVIDSGANISIDSFIKSLYLRSTRLMNGLSVFLFFFIFNGFYMRNDRHESTACRLTFSRCFFNRFPCQYLLFQLLLESEWTRQGPRRSLI